MQIIQLGFDIVVIAAVTEGIQVADVVGIGNLGSACIENLTIAPCVITIFSHNRAGAVKQESHVILCVLSTIICRAALLYREYTRVVVEKLQAVALSDQISGRIIAERDAVLFGPATACVIREGVAVECRKLSAELPCGGFAAIGGRVADGIICKCFIPIGQKLIAVFGVAVCGADAVQQVQLRGGFCGNRVFIPCKDVAVVVIGIGSGLAGLRVVLAGQPAEGVILVAAGCTAVFHDLHDIAHAVIAILNAVGIGHLSIDILRVPDGSGEICGMVAVFQIGDALTDEGLRCGAHGFSGISAEHIHGWANHLSVHGDALQLLCRGQPVAVLVGMGDAAGSDGFALQSLFVVVVGIAFGQPRAGYGREAPLVVIAVAGGSGYAVYRFFEFLVGGAVGVGDALAADGGFGDAAMQIFDAGGFDAIGKRDRCGLIVGILPAVGAGQVAVLPVERHALQPALAVIAVLHDIVSAPQLGQQARRVCLARAVFLIKNQTAEAVWKTFYDLLIIRKTFFPFNTVINLPLAENKSIWMFFIYFLF